MSSVLCGVPSQLRTVPRGAEKRRNGTGARLDGPLVARSVGRLGSRRGTDGDRPHRDKHRYFLFRIPISRLDVTRWAEIAACGRYSIR